MITQHATESNSDTQNNVWNVHETVHGRWAMSNWYSTLQLCADAFRCIIKLRAVLHSHVESVEIGLEKHCKLFGPFSVFYLAQHGILRQNCHQNSNKKTLWEQVETAKNRKTFNKPQISNSDVKMYNHPLLFASTFIYSNIIAQQIIHDFFLSKSALNIPFVSVMLT